MNFTLRILGLASLIRQQIAINNMLQLVLIQKIEHKWSKKDLMSLLSTLI